MRKSTSRIVRLPGEVREEINRKMDAGWEYRAIRKWLFEEVAECDVPALGLVKGDSFSLAWLRSAKSTEHAWHHCELALGNWFRMHHPQWVTQQVRGSESMRMVKRAKMLTQVAGNRVASSRGLEARQVASSRVAGSQGDGVEEESEGISVEGGNVLMRSVLIDAISQVTNFGGSAVAPGAMADSPTSARAAGAREIAQLANAWARLNAGKMEEEKLKLKTEDLRQAAFDEIGRDVRGNAEAMELFEKLREVMTREKEGKAVASSK